MTAIAGGGIRTNRYSNQRSIGTGVSGSTLTESFGTGGTGRVSGVDARFASPGVGESRGGFEQAGGLVYDWLTEPAAPPVEAIGDADGTGAASASSQYLLGAAGSAGGIGAAVAVSSLYSAEADQFFARTTGLTDERKALYDAYISALVAGGVWAKLQCHYLFAAPDSATAVTNLKSSSFPGTITGSPVFTTDVGFNNPTNGATTHYIDTGYNPSVHASATNHHISLWNATNQSGTGYEMGCFDGGAVASTRIMCKRSTGSFETRHQINSSAFLSAFTGLSDPRGLHLVSTDAAGTGAETYFNGGAGVGGGSLSTAPNFNILICAMNNGGFPAGSTNQIRSASIGTRLTAGEVTAFYNAQDAFLDAIEPAGTPSAADGAAAGAGAASGVGAEITILRPDGDTALDGWTNQADGTSNIYQSIDEATASDADYVQSPAIVVAGASPEVQQFLDRATGMDSTHVDAFTALIDGIVSDGEWAGLDGLWIGATDTEAHSFLNLKENTGTYDLTILTNGVESIVQTADQGWTTTGLNSSLDTGYTIGDGNAVQDSTAYGYYNLTSSTSADSAVAMGTIASNYLCIIMNQGGSTYCMASDATFLNTTALNHQGMFVASRTTSSALAAYRNSNSTAVISGSATSGTPSAFSITLLAANSDGTGANLSRFTADTIAAAFIGSELDSAGAVRISNRINAYMTAVGANVY